MYLCVIVFSGLCVSVYVYLHLWVRFLVLYHCSSRQVDSDIAIYNTSLGV